MPLEIEKYMPFMEGLELPHAQKEDFLRVVWGLMESCVDQAFGMHPVQQAKSEAQTSRLHAPSRAVDSNHISIANSFTRAGQSVDGGLTTDNER